MSVSPDYLQATVPWCTYARRCSSKASFCASPRAASVAATNWRCPWAAARPHRSRHTTSPRAVAAILQAPGRHVGQIYNLTGSRSKHLHWYAGEYSEALDRRISYRDVDPAAWREQLVQWKLPAHLPEHVTAMAQLNCENRYDRLTDDVEQLTGRPAMGMRSSCGDTRRSSRHGSVREPERGITHSVP